MPSSARELETVMLLAALLLARLTLPNPRPFAFFFYTCGDLPDLHSFPTRRSSDLLSVRVIEADRAPAACGEKVTAIVQLPPATILLAHVFVWLETPEFSTVTAMLLIDNIPAPELETVMLLAALRLVRFTLPNPRPFAGFSDTCGEVPVPVSSTD